MELVKRTPLKDSWNLKVDSLREGIPVKDCYKFLGVWIDRKLCLKKALPKTQTKTQLYVLQAFTSAKLYES